MVYQTKSNSQATEATEEVCQIEQQIVEQQAVRESIREYIEKEALSRALQVVEEDLFRMLLTLGVHFFKEVVARHGTGKSEGPVIDDQGRELTCHRVEERKYLSIFGPVAIERDSYWKMRSPGSFPVDAKLNLPERKCSYMKWTRSGAQAVLILGALNRNGDLNAYWDHCIENEHQRLSSSLN